MSCVPYFRIFGAVVSSAIMSDLMRIDGIRQAVATATTPEQAIDLLDKANILLAAAKQEARRVRLGLDRVIRIAWTCVCTRFAENQEVNR